MIPLSDISAVLVTRGDVDLSPILESLPYDEVVVWNNADRPFDCKVFGRYLGIFETTRPVIYIQDDDCVVTCHEQLRGFYEPGKIVANMPADHRPGEPPMLGWGALFDRDLPWEAFRRWCQAGYPIDRLFIGYPESIFTALVPCTRLNIGSHSSGVKGHENLPWATDETRSYQQPNHYAEFALMLERAQAVAAGKRSTRDVYLEAKEALMAAFEASR